MSELRVGVFGKGRMGGAIARAAGPALAWNVSREAPPSGTAGTVDVAIDASSGAAVAARVEWATRTGTPLVIGTTGWSVDRARLTAAAAAAFGILVAPNFSLVVQLQRRLALVVARFAALDPDRDLYLVEHHHARKKDAPSGTARLLASTLLAGCPRKTRAAAPPADGPLPADVLSVSAIRAGHTWSTHVVGLDAPGEELTIAHAARSAEPYARGALDAARWLAGPPRKTGLFTMDDVAKDVLDPLFTDLTDLEP